MTPESAVSSESRSFRWGFLFFQVAAVALSLAITAGLFGFLGLQQLMFVSSPGKFTKNKEEVKLLELKAPSKPPPRPQTRPQPSRPQTKSDPLQSVSQNFDWAGSLGSAGGRGAVWGIGGTGSAMGGKSAGSPDQDARPLFQAPPAYPDKAKKYGIKGEVRVVLTVGLDGGVKSVEFLETPGDYGFEEAIREAVSKWRYEPAMAGGVPVEQRIEQPFRF